MQFIFFWHFLTLVFYWLSALPNIAYGSLRIKTDTNEVLSLSTLDYFLYRQPYYEYEGTGINWPWKNNTVNCEMQAFNVSDPSIRHITLRRFNYTNVAIFVNVGDALAAGCHTIAQVSAVTI
ncbi:hypothetical protein BDF19DRAFT_444816 [Syncephalis fuscata]|nr:hypothetical protein BDF19DRAFT_444816 [Syncephalis fuscata]